ncbi:hypothetical protein QE152_g25770 [Popillia japonica]|uniref:Uncharacterized protein n=1 Tax=Popillia japonica TaxID=7064 RepID=A0AAW1K0L1_POPJA
MIHTDAEVQIRLGTVDYKFDFPTAAGDLNQWVGLWPDVVYALEQSPCVVVSWPGTMSKASINWKDGGKTEKEDDARLTS